MTVIQVCPHCGAINQAETGVCCLCDERLSPGRPFRPAPIPALARAEGNLALASEPDWRNELAGRLEAYRARRGRLRAEPAREERPSAGRRVADADSVPAPPVSLHRGAAPRRRSQPERFEIDLAQPAFEFRGAPAYPFAPGAQSAPLLAAAPLKRRGRAALWDVALLLFAYGAFLSLFAALGGRITFSRFDLAVGVITLALFYAVYFTLFTLLGGATPGMMLQGLRVIGFDGGEPSARQMAWRSFGYIVSAGTLMLGFLWALWDEDGLCWHDRISQTCLVAERGAPPDFRGESL